MPPHRTIWSPQLVSADRLKNTTKKTKKTERKSLDDTGRKLTVCQFDNGGGANCPALHFSYRFVMQGKLVRVRLSFQIQ